MNPYSIYTLTADKSSEIRRIWDIIGFSHYVALIDIEDGLNDFFLRHNCITIDASGEMTLRWRTRDDSTIEATPAAFRTWFFTGVKEVTEHIPTARPSTPIEEAYMDRPKIEVQALEELLQLAESP